MDFEQVEIDSGGLKLEGDLIEGEKSGVFALITHPHPLYGGSMDNNVVRSMSRGFFDAGAGVLRFNFRGVGRSEGAYDDGVGETQDLEAAAKFLVDRGAARVILSGYSYGAWVVLRMGALGPCFFVSPPLGVMDFTGLFPPGPGSLVVVGDSDPLAPFKEVEKWMEGSGVEVRVIEGADHFFAGREGEVERAVNGWAKELI